MFADSSAIVKLYVPEPGHRDVDSLPEPLVVSQLAAVEVPAAFWRKHRIGELDAADAAILARAFESDLAAVIDPRYVAVAANSQLIRQAARLVAVHPLRAYDAMQLVSALAVADALDTTISLAAFDATLRRAAAAEGLHLVPAAT